VNRDDPGLDHERDHAQGNGIYIFKTIEDTQALKNKIFVNK